MFDGKAIGSIDVLEKGKAVVNYGMFTTKVSVEQLELVEAKKWKGPIPYIKKAWR